MISEGIPQNLSLQTFINRISAILYNS